MSARNDILHRLRSGRDRAVLPQQSSGVVSASPSVSVGELVTRFSEEAAALGVECHLESSDAAVRDRVRAIVGPRPALSWNRDQLPYGVGSVVSDVSFGEAAREIQAAAEIGITGCDAAIAETASLVLCSSPGRARTASLLPPIHLAIVQRHQLCLSMSEMFARHPEVSNSASCTIITGPSRTADIELTLTLGIHGPGRVIVIIGP